MGSERKETVGAGLERSACRLSYPGPESTGRAHPTVAHRSPVGERPPCALHPFPAAPPPASFATNDLSACPRWLIAFFSAGKSSAAVRSTPDGRKIGSYPKPPDPRD